jgi:sugar phosphate isomerase/epimerase
MRFGISSHLFHARRLAPADLETLVRQGFTDIEIFATPTHFDYRDPSRVRELRGWLDDLGLKAGSMHGPICDGFRGGVWGQPWSNASGDRTHRQQAVDETLAAIEAAERLGCETIVLHLGLPRPQPLPPGDNDARSLRRSLDALAEPAAASGVRLAFEVIPNDLSTPEALADLVTGEDAFGEAGVCLDVGHAHLMGGVAEAAETLSGAIVTTHVHDNDGRDDQHLVPFGGSIDWPAALTALWKVGYANRLVFEVADTGDPADVLARTVGARARLQAILNELAEPMMFEEP